MKIKLIILFLIVSFFYKANAIIIDTSQFEIDIYRISKFHESNIDSALILVKKYEQILPKIRNDKKYIKLYYKAQNQIAITYAMKGDYVKAFSFFKRNTEVDTTFFNAKELGTAFNNLAISYMNFGNYSKAIENYIIGLKYREKGGNQEEIAGSYLNIGLCYYRQNILDEALINYKKALEIINQSKMSNPTVIIKLYNNTGLIFLNKRVLDSAEIYFNKALELGLENNLKIEIASTYNYFAELYSKRNKTTEAINMALKALETNLEIKSDYGKNLTFVNLGNFYLDNKKYNLSQSYLDSALVFFKSQRDLWEIKDIYALLAQNFTAQQNFKIAALYKDSVISIKDSIFNEESISNQKNTQALYETEKKDQEIKLLNKDNLLKEAKIKEQQFIEYIFGGAAISLMLILYFIYKNLVQKRKANKLLEEQKHIILQKNEELNSINVEISEHRNEIVSSINYAKKIQMALLKNEQEETKNIPEHFILFKPKDIVSGDFYWSHFKKNFAYIAAVDCTGHGVPGGFLTMLGASFLNEINTTSEALSPAIILDKLREKIVKELSSDGITKDGMDISLVKINFDNLEIEWAGANNPLYLIRNNSNSKEIEIIKPNKQPIGYFDNALPFTNHKLKLNKDDLIYLFTDGFADQFGGDKNRKMGYQSFREKLIEISSLNMNSQKTELLKHFENWQGKEEQIDDVCVIGVKI